MQRLGSAVIKESPGSQPHIPDVATGVKDARHQNSLNMKILSFLSECEDLPLWTEKTRD